MCCCVILDRQSNTILDALGVDVLHIGNDYLAERCTGIYESIKVTETNTDGCAKIFPDGPTCYVGEMIFPFVTCSPSDGITLTLLTQCFSTLTNILDLMERLLHPLMFSIKKKNDSKVPQNHVDILT